MADSLVASTLALVRSAYYLQRPNIGVSPKPLLYHFITISHGSVNVAESMSDHEDEEEDLLGSLTTIGFR